MKNKKILIFLLCFILIFAAGCSQNNDSQDPTVVTTKSGTVQGSTEEGVTSFKGVPFAQPPVGDLRFAPPQPVESWDETLDCTKFKAIPPQVSKTGKEVMDEDCLYLNIWKPEKAETEKLPVLVFIHGGAFASGSASDSKFDGTAFAQDGVICITVEYRLNALGFLATEELKQESGYTGNLGLLDQIQSLKWVKENVEDFGGDSENITISGESAGSMSVSALVMSPMAKGLFNKAIMESGSLFGQPLISPATTGSPEQALATGKAFMKQIGASSLEQLKKTETKDLVDNSLFSMDVTTPNPLTFMPVFDGKVIDSSPYQSLQKGNYNDVKILAGYNSDEGTLFIPENLAEAKYTSLVKRTFGKNAEKVLDRFPVDADHSATERARQLVKLSFQMGSKIFGDVFSENNQDVYLYNFDYHVPDFDKKGMGSMHGLELLFAFDSAPEDLEMPKDGQSFTDAVHNYWVSFAKTGDPNYSDKCAPWPKYTTDKKEMLQLNSDFKTIPLQDEKDIDFLTELVWGK